jgi:uncharacterized protein YcfJ
MRTTVRTALGVAGLAVAMQAAAQGTFYEGEGFKGRSFAANAAVFNFDRIGFNDRASSVTVDYGMWQVCEDAGFNGRCETLRPGNYPSLAALGMNNRTSSVRPVVEEAAIAPPVAPNAPPPPVVAGPPPDEPLHQVNVAAVHAVVGPPEQRCSIERQQVIEGPSGGANIPGAIVGGVIGGVLGHQIGAGRGRDVATAGGAVAGAAIGANVGRGDDVSTRDVQRCTRVSDAGPPAYWDVTYYFRGREHHAQFNAPPSSTIWVDDDGVPRG